MKKINLVKIKDSTKDTDLTLNELTRTCYGVLLIINRHRHRSIIHQFNQALYQFIGWDQNQVGYLTNRIDDKNFFGQKELYDELCKHKIFVFKNKKELFEWFTGEEE